MAWCPIPRRARPPSALIAGFATCLLAGAAGAVEYEIVAGEVTETASDVSRPLQGFLEASSPEVPITDPEGREIFVFTDFDLVAEDEHFRPGIPVEFDGLQPALFLFPWSGLSLEGDTTVHDFLLYTGGAPVRVDDDIVTFRFIHWRGQGGSNSAQGTLPDGLPARFQVSGSLYESDRFFRIPTGECRPLVLVPPTTLPGTIGGGQIGGAGISTGSGGSVTISIAPDRLLPEIQEGPTIQRPGGSVTITAVPTRPLLAIPGGSENERLGGTNVFQSFPSLTLTASEPPRALPVSEGIARFDGGPRTPIGSDLSLEALGITAPSGATIQFENGVLTVTTEGDLLVEGPFPEIEGLEELNLVAGGTFETTGGIEGAWVLSGNTVNGNSGVLVSTPGADRIDPIQGELVLPTGPIQPIVIGPFCDALREIFPSERREIGHFALSAAVVEEVRVEVEPRKRQPRVDPLRNKKVRVAIMGSEDLDVRDIVVHSLRLGPDGAEPSGRRRARIKDLDRDGYRDLLVRFRAGETGLSVGDTTLCLTGDSATGSAIRGCDAVKVRSREGRRGRGRGRGRHGHDD